MAKEEKKEKVDSVSTVVYKAHLHCPKCAHDIRKPLMRTPGVHSVDIKFESGEISVKGTFDAKKMQERIERMSKKKVEKVKEVVSEEKLVKDTKKETVRTTKIKAHMHCDQCERDLRKKLLKHKGIHNVKTDIKAQTLTIEGTIESEKLLAFMKKRVHKHAEIISPKQDKEQEKKEKVTVEEKKEKVTVEEKKEKEQDKKEEKKEKVTVEVKSKETTEIIEFKEEKKVEVKTKEGNVPYFIHYVYAPQTFSDENPNACSIM